MSSLSHNEFNALYAVWQKPNASQRTLAELAGTGLGTMNSALHEVEGKGYISEGRITAAGMAALLPYRIDNAVIMAAGLSSRFAPVSYEKPKGLLKVRGEVLIERQIRQLHEVGINDIIVVVGYKKEHFFYLEEELGVHIVVNPEFASRNNNSTLNVVKEALGNTYICSSDDYFTENPFERYAYGAYYAAQYSEGGTPEWCIQTGSWDRITGVTIGGSDSWYMVGHAYFDRAFSQRFVEILEDEYVLPETADKLWEDLFIEHVDELSMTIRKYPDGVIFEFDSLDELRDFDPLFLENLDSQIFDNICDVLGCTKSEIHDVYPLKKGLTNLSCHFATSSGEFVYRHPGVGTEKMLDRSSEAAAQKIARRLGLDDTFIYEDPKTGWKISRFIPNCKLLDAHNDEELKAAMEMARKLHSEDVTLEHSFDYLVESKHYESLLTERGPINVPGFAELSEMAENLKALADADGCPTCLTHNDFFGLNILIDEQGNMSLIDWEYAGMADYASDYGTFVVTSKLSDEEAAKALCYYFGREPSEEEVRHNYAYVGLAGWCWYVWALLKESEGDYVGDWLLVYYRYAKKYLRLALSMYGKDR